jgi:hypothetical protein
MNTAKGQIREKEMTVYWVRANGEMMLAPATNMPPFFGWRRVECKTVSETEQFSRRFAHQEWTKFRDMKVEEHIKAQKRLNEIEANCKLRLAQGCISAADEEATRRTLRGIDRKRTTLYNLITNEPDLSRSALTIEKYDQGKIIQMSGGKRRGLAGDEVNEIAQLIEGAR